MKVEELKIEFWQNLRNKTMQFGKCDYPITGTRDEILSYIDNKIKNLPQP